ncbi:MAG TPA: sugar phosphate isomerase/epimerase [Actinomycetota bacterium]|nr:sugar phosphate isomerase/epimerase [Actinomycetota bacterium]
MSDSSGPAIVCSTISVFSKPIDEAFGLIADAGFDGIEIMVTKDPDTRDERRIRELSEDHGLPVAAIHAPFLLVTRRVWGVDPVGKIDRALELARAVDAPLVVVHPPYRWQRGYRRWLDERLPAIAEERPTVAVENMFPMRVRGRSVATVHARQSLEDLARSPRVVLDTSHAAVAGLDPVDLADRLGDRLAHVHLSNNAGRGWDSHLPLDQGVLDLGRFLEALATRGFEGAVSLEIDLRPFMGDEEALRRILFRNRELCAERLGLAA